MTGELTHFDAAGAARMVDVSEKTATSRVATARGEVRMQPETLERIARGTHAKGDVLGVARVAGLLGLKQTDRLIPLCHPVGVTGANIEFTLDAAASRVQIEAVVRATGQTGVEMEALTAVAVAALTIYDMGKAIDKGMVIGEIRLIEKSGGKSGLYRREGER